MAQNQNYMYPTPYVPNQNHPHPVYYPDNGTTVAPQPRYPAVAPPFSSGYNTESPTEKKDKKRPKYTRSKDGCMVCRRKKIKCDESKPSCQRCVHGRRECVWPDPDKKRKSGARKKTLIEERPSTADSSSRLSDSSSTSYDYSEGAMSLNAASSSSPYTVYERRSSDIYVQSHQTHAANANISSGSRQSMPGRTVSYEPLGNLAYNPVPDYSRYQYTYSPGLFGMYGPESCSQPTISSSATSSRSTTGMSWTPAQFRHPTNQYATTRSTSQYALDRNMPSVYGSSAERQLYSY